MLNGGRVICTEMEGAADWQCEVYSEGGEVCKKENLLYWNAVNKCINLRIKKKKERKKIVKKKKKRKKKKKEKKKK